MSKKASQLLIGVLTFVLMLTAGVASSQTVFADDDTADATTTTTTTTDNSASDTTTTKKTTKYDKLYKVAKQQLGKRYSYGSTGPSSFDCSGLTKYVYKKAVKKTLPRTAAAQYAKYKHVSGANLKKGDLIFFNYGSGIAHVGIYVGNGQMIDAQNNGVKKESFHASWWHPYVSGYARVSNMQKAAK
ncbi:hydrolase [Lactobacillus paracollinoides] [Lactiplantibacillus mudanjiangensis]|uniref:NlpC/P60 family protein n=1 Tax=Lactiplantibacillus mudanjiangensis TaxID=1296538 RepID=UPI001015AE7E|nr:hydrolase [Lactobacillus paracollinoides] [Lactiplantibacillus mudanjiangensis]